MLLNGETSQGYFQRMLWVPVGFATGCAAYFAGDAEPGWLTYSGAFIALGVGIALVMRLAAPVRALPEFALILLGFAIFGFCYSGFRTHTMPDGGIHSPFDRVMVEGWVTDLSGHTERQRVSLKVHAITGIENVRLPDIVRLSQRPDDALMPGRFVRCFASLQPPPSPMLRGDYDFERNAYFDRLGGVGFVFGKCEPGRIAEASNPEHSFAVWINAQRQQFAAYIASMSGGGAGLAAALLTGNRSYLSEEDEETLRASGLAHLLAISGLHMSLAAGVFYFGIFRLLACFPMIALRVPIQKIAGIGSLLAITAYLLFSGASVATQRAYIMVVSVLVYSLLDRPLLSFQALAIAMMTVLVLAPWSVLTPGFQMSFAATGALLAGYRVYDQKRKTQKGLLRTAALRFVEGIIRTSWIAGLATMPFALFHFGRAAPLGFFANIVVMPLITLICVPVAAVSVILLPFGLSDFGFTMLSHSLGWVLDLAGYFTRDWKGWQSVLGDQMPTLAFGFMVAGLLVWTIIRNHRLKIALILVGGAMITWVSAPKPILIYDGAGHIFTREGAVWSELDIGGRGLRPLRFADTSERACEAECFIAENSIHVRVEEQELTISLDPQNPITIKRSDTRVAHILQSDGMLDINWLNSSRCRPWSATYPDC